MNGRGSDDTSDADKDASWANETLPLGTRRLLLTRDLDKALGRRHQHGQAGPRQESESPGPGGEAHPKADG